MIRCFALDEIPPLSPSVLTIGNFDGVHLGHQKLLKRADVAVTFSNHPVEFFTGKKVPKLCTLEERLRKMEACGITCALVLPFDKALSELSYQEFLEMLRTKIPFKKLALGEGATFGKGREGTPENLRELGIDVEYISKEKLDGTTISSGQIRKWLAEGRKGQAQRALGSPPFTPPQRHRLQDRNPPGS